MRDIASPERFIENHLMILNTDRQIVPFKLKAAQRDFLRQVLARGGLVGRDLLLKSRKQGFTTLSLALLFYEALTRDNTLAAYLSHEKAVAQRAFEMVKRFVHYLPETVVGTDGEKIKFRPKLDRNNKTEISFLENGSKIYIGTAGSVSFGRGDTPNLVVLDEIAFYEDSVWNTLLTGLLNSLDFNNSWVFAPSTPNGYNHFRSLYVNSKSGDDIFRTYFYPWWWGEKKDVTIHSGSMLVPEEIRGDFEPTTEEISLMFRNNLSLDHIRWRRAKIMEMTATTGRWQIFKQEFPETDHDCFLFSGEMFFHDESVAYYVSQVRPPIATEENGLVRIWKRPETGARYIIGADPSEGLSTSESRSSARILNVMNSEVVAAIRGRIPPERFGKLLNDWGINYNKAVIGVERNNHGHLVLKVLRDLKYPYIWRDDQKKDGWLTSAGSRQLLLDEYAAAVAARSLTIYDEELISEMESFRWHDGRPEKPEGGWDDGIFSAAIAWKLRYASGHTVTSQPMRVGNWRR